jgi:hypothetical protein
MKEIMANLELDLADNFDDSAEKIRFDLHKCELSGIYMSIGSINDLASYTVIGLSVDELDRIADCIKAFTANERKSIVKEPVFTVHSE